MEEKILSYADGAFEGKNISYADMERIKEAALYKYRELISMQAGEVYAYNQAVESIRNEVASFSNTPASRNAFTPKSKAKGETAAIVISVMAVALLTIAIIAGIVAMIFLGTRWVIRKAGDIADGSEVIRYKIHDGKHMIGFCESGLNIKNMRKDLVIEVPEGFFLEDLKVDSVSADINVDELDFEDMSVNSVAAVAQLNGCNCTEDLEIDTVSGDIYISGSYRDIDVSSVSAYVQLNLDSNPEDLKIDSVSGNISAGFPGDLKSVTVRAPGAISVNGEEYRAEYRSPKNSNGRGNAKITSVLGNVNITTY